MELTETAQTVLKKRYYLPNENTWSDLCNRPASFFAKDENEKNTFYNLMFNGDFLPNSPTLMNAGTSINSFSACFVLPIEDNISSIYKFYSDAAKISKSGGGVGSNYSKLRPSNSKVKTTDGVASGPLSFMEVQDKSTDIIKQGGRRRGANMGILDCSHSDIFDFVKYKEDKTKLTNYNLSVNASDNFMSKIDEEGEERKLWTLLCKKAWESAEPGVLFGDTAERANTVPHLGRLESTNPCQPAYATILTPNGISTIGRIKIGDTIWSGKQWTKVINKWGTGIKPVYKYTFNSFLNEEVVFIGTENHKVVSNGIKIEVKNVQNIDCNILGAEGFFDGNVALKIKQYIEDAEVFDITVDCDSHTYWTENCIVSNCGEQWLLNYESCSLGSINVGNFVKNREIDWDRLETTIRGVVLFKNRVLDKTIMPIPECQEALEKTRKIGIGLMGLHDLLIQLELRYDSEEGRKIAGSVMKFIADICNDESVKLGEKEGVYKGWVEGCPKRRNANLTTTAPTGTLSMIADCSSGVEPYYSVITVKNVLDGEKLILINKWFEKSLLKNNSQEEVDYIVEKVKQAGTINIPEVPENIKELFKGANDISPEDHVLMQAEMQKYIDSSISKTVNLPRNATIEDVDRIYRLAYKTGCKGVTVYRDGSRDNQVLTNSNVQDIKSATRPEKISFNLSPKRPKVLDVEIHHCTIKGSPWIVIVGLFNGIPYELFAGELNDLYIPKTCKNGVVEKTKSNKYSLKIQIRNSEVEFKDIANTLMNSEQRALTRMISLSLRHGVHYEFIVGQLEKASGDITDFASVVTRVLKKYIKQFIYSKTKKCEECGGDIIFVEGCNKCSSCGLSKCG